MFVREVELFQRIPSHVIDEIAEFSTEESYSVEQVIFREGAFADYLYILEDGQIALTLPGKEGITFAVDDAGSVFGWSALVEPRRYTATAECSIESTVIKIDGERLLRLFERHPNEGLMIMRRLAGVIGARLVRSYRWIGVHRP